MDTANKRASSVQILSWFVLAPPIPDGSIDQADRQHTTHSYVGVLAGAGGAAVVPLRMLMGEGL